MIPNSRKLLFYFLLVLIEYVSIVHDAADIIFVHHVISEKYIRLDFSLVKI